MTLFRRVPTKRWRDAWFRPLPDELKLLYLYLSTAPTTGAIPGVVLGGPHSHAEAMIWPGERFIAQADQLAAVLVDDEPLLVHDWTAQLAWLPIETDFDLPYNASILVAWVHFWAELPDSAVRDALHAFLRPRLAPLCERWGQETRHAASLRGGFDVCFPRRSRDRARNRFTNGHDTVSDTVSRTVYHIGSGEGSGEVVGSGEGSGGGRESSGRGRDAFLALADELWGEQESRRLALRRSGVSPDARAIPDGSQLKRELLARISEVALDPRSGGLDSARSSCVHVLDIYEAEARTKKTLTYFNGRQWEPKRFAQALSMTLDDVQKLAKRGERGRPGTPSARNYKHTGDEQYPDGEVDS